MPRATLTGPRETTLGNDYDPTALGYRKIGHRRWHKSVGRGTVLVEHAATWRRIVTRPGQPVSVLGYHTWSLQDAIESAEYALNRED